MKKLQLFFMALVMGMFTMNAQTQEVGPFSSQPDNSESTIRFIIYCRCWCEWFDWSEWSSRSCLH